MLLELKDNILLAALFLFLLGLSSWLQFGLLAPAEFKKSDLERNDPDYYLEDLVTSSIDDKGVQYKIIADKMLHFPEGDRLLLENPHIIQYVAGSPPRHIYAEYGRLYDNRKSMLLTGNVRVIQGHNQSVKSVVSSEKMTIHLEQ